jgi:hypothetical protein
MLQPSIKLEHVEHHEGLAIQQYDVTPDRDVLSSLRLWECPSASATPLLSATSAATSTQDHVLNFTTFPPDFGFKTPRYSPPLRFSDALEPVDQLCVVRRCHARLSPLEGLPATRRILGERSV